MRLTSGWVGYISRSYTQIKSSLITRMRIRVPELTDHSESNLMILLLSMFAGLAEQFHYYIDNVARESFIATARRYNSMVKLVRMVDYRIMASNPASADLTLTFTPALTANYTLPSSTIFQDAAGNRFITETAIDIPINTSSASIPVVQKVITVDLNIGTTLGVANEQVALPDDYVDNSINIKVGTDTSWQYKETLGLSGPLDKHYTVRVLENQAIVIQFGDNTNGAIPPGSEPILATYYTTNGVQGNVTSDSITTIVSTLSLPAGVTATVNNDFESVGGLGIQTIESIRRKAPLHVRTNDRAVTRQDYKDIAVMAIGVNKSDLRFDCGKTVDVYISPEGGGIAPIALLNSTADFIEARRMVTTFVNVRPAGESVINISLFVQTKFRISKLQTELAIREALLDYYSIQNSTVNKAIRRSDIYALVDNLPEVEYLTLERLSITPYARPINHQVSLNWTVETLDNSTTELYWKALYNGGSFAIYKEGQYVGTATTGVPFTDFSNTITITINSGPYSVGYEWEFTTYPVNSDLVIDDFSLPITQDSAITLNIEEQTIVN